jgi:hypothetical protein
MRSKQKPVQDKYQRMKLPSIEAASKSDLVASKIPGNLSISPKQLQSLETGKTRQSSIAP